MDTVDGSDKVAPREEGTQLTRRTLLIVITVFWLYVSLTTVAQWDLMEQASGRAPSSQSAINTVTCVLLFPVLLLLTFVSRRIGYERDLWYWRVAGHFALAAVFGLCARPLMTVARAFVENVSVAEAFGSMIGQRMAVLAPFWAAPALYDGMQYLVSQALIAGFTYAVRYRHEQALREQLATLYDRARLNALRMQVSPHFLYNTLSAIAGLIRTSPPAAEGMVTRLGDLFRRALAERDVELVTLEQELEYAENYLEIQHLRFAERLTYHMQVEDALRAALIPPLLLQPLLENAVEHGLRESEGAVTITLACNSEGERIKIVVRNRSEGVRLDLTGNGTRRGLGLRNVRERLEAAFRNAAEFQVRALSPGEYEARMVFPRLLEPAPARMSA